MWIVLGLFFLLCWISIIAALTGAERRRGRSRLLLYGRLDEDFRAALAKSDHAALCRYYRLALAHRLPPRDEQLIRINLACACNGLADHRQALEELDKVALAHLSPAQVALWLNNRAYTLALLGRADDALDNLKDAEELLGGDEDSLRDLSLRACMAGTRGIALYEKGDLGAAEQALREALHLEEDHASFSPDLAAEPNPARTAERWWWLGQIARARGDVAEQRRCLRRAAAHPATEYGAKALGALAGKSPGQAA